MGKTKIDPRTLPVLDTPNSERELLFERCRNSYLADPARHCLEWWYEQMLASVCTWPELDRRARREGWAQQRDKFINRAKQELVEELSRRFVQKQLKELSEIERVRDAAFEMLQPTTAPDGRLIPPAPAKTYEGMIAAFCKMHELLEKSRDRLLPILDKRVNAIEAQSATAPQLEEAKAFTGPEYQLMARAILEKRMKERQALGQTMPGPAAEKTDDESPELAEEFLDDPTPVPV
jgi:hypothetical protein